MGIDGVAAANTLKTYAPLSRYGACLYYVWLAYRAHGARSSTTYPTAYSAWKVTKKRHTDWNPPAGVPVWFGRRNSDGNMDGDVVISLGGGRVVATDQPTWGRVGTCTIAERQKLVGRQYLGWSEDFLGNTISFVMLASTGKLTVDGDWGAATTSALQKVLGVTQDGQMGPVTIKALQKRLGVTQDGQMGPVTIKALQVAVGATVDGEIGPDTTSKLQTYLNAGGDFLKLTVDGAWGPATTRAFQLSLGVTVDGELGPKTWSAFQKAVGVAVDGDPGPQTYSAMQVAVGATVDGQLGAETTSKLQVFLNAGKKWGKVTLPAPAPVQVATKRTPVYPGAVRAWALPWLTKRTAKVDGIFIHHQAGTQDDEDFFKTKNSRSSWPTFNVKADGTVVEFADPTAQQPVSTQGHNADAISIETQNTTGAPAWGISDASHEAIARIVVWASAKYGFPIDRAHVRRHDEVYATVCPGPSMDVDRIVRRALELVPTTPSTDDTVPVKRSWLKSVMEAIKGLLG
jgi:peptidoglycan hydrolase-like protein with peptidoglycan-binding domain